MGVSGLVCNIVTGRVRVVPYWYKPGAKLSGGTAASALAAGSGCDTGQGICHILIAGFGVLIHEIAVIGLHGLLNAHHPL